MFIGKICNVLTLKIEICLHLLFTKKPFELYNSVNFTDLKKTIMYSKMSKLLPANRNDIWILLNYVGQQPHIKVRLKYIRA